MTYVKLHAESTGECRRTQFRRYHTQSPCRESALSGRAASQPAPDPWILAWLDVRGETAVNMDNTLPIRPTVTKRLGHTRPVLCRWLRTCLLCRGSRGWLVRCGRRGIVDTIQVVLVLVVHLDDDGFGGGGYGYGDGGNITAVGGRSEAVAFELIKNTSVGGE